MTNKERNKRFRKERTKRLKVRSAIQRDTYAELTRLLKLAEEDIQGTLKHSPSEWQAWYLPQVQQSIKRTMSTFINTGSATINSAATNLWQAGINLIDKPIAAGGVQIAGLLTDIDPKQLVAMRTFMTGRIQDIGETVANRINSNLGLVAMGAQTTGDAIAQIANVFEVGGRSRAQTIVRTELGRAYSTAAQQRMTQAQQHLPGLKKQWRRSGKIHSRLAHDAADGQIQPVDEPFIIGGARLMYPRDPQASVKDTINCGCESLPYMEHWEMTTPGKKPFTAEEIALDPNKRKLADAAKSKPIELQTPRVRKTVRDIENRFAGQAIERAAVIDKQGKVLFEVDGNADRVKLSPDQLKQLKGNVVTHNHPGVGSFSEGDIAMAAVYQVAEMRVVDDIYSYSIQPPTIGWNKRLWQTAILPAMQAIEAEVTGEYFDAMIAGKMSQAAYEENYQHEVWRRVSKLIDMKYRRRKR